MPIRWASVSALVVLVTAGACASWSESSSPTLPSSSTTAAPGPTSASTEVATSTSPETDASTCRGFDHDSPAHFDPSGGVYATYLMGVNVPQHTLTFDVIQWLRGDAADAAYAKESGDSSGAPNDYFIVDESDETRTAPVADDVRVRLVRLHETGDAGLTPGTFDELPEYTADYRSAGDNRLSGNPFWLTLAGETITDICEQYVP